jgi:hypothetical protein
VLLVVEALLLLFTLRKWIVEDGQAKAIEAVDRGTQQVSIEDIAQSTSYPMRPVLTLLDLL